MVRGGIYRNGFAAGMSLFAYRRRRRTRPWDRMRGVAEFWGPWEYLLWVASGVWFGLNFTFLDKWGHKLLLADLASFAIFAIGLGFLARYLHRNKTNVRM
jgi:transposase InsO family protein